MTHYLLSTKLYPTIKLLLIVLLLCTLFFVSGCSYIPFVGKDDAEDTQARQVQATKEKQAPVDIVSTQKREGEAYSAAEQYQRATNPKLMNSEYFINEHKAGGHRGAKKRLEEKDKEKKELSELKEEIGELKEAVISLKGEEDRGGYNYRQQPAAAPTTASSCRKEDVDYYLEKGFTTDQITQICSIVIN